MKKHEKELDFERKMFEAKMKFQTELQLAKEKVKECKTRPQMAHLCQAMSYRRNYQNFK